MPSTHDLQNEHLHTPYVDPSPNHWSESQEWMALQKARAAATTRLFPAWSVHSKDVDVENTPEVRAALAAFERAYPPVDEPVPVTNMTPRQAEMQAATIELRRAVDRMKALAHGDRIVRLVQDMLNE
jgi:hypothetical protein